MGPFLKEVGSFLPTLIGLIFLMGILSIALMWY